MKKLLIPALLSIGMATSSAANAFAILDGWQIDLGGGNLTTNVGHLDVQSGDSTVRINTNGAALAVGQSFSELGSILSFTYTKENVVGIGDNLFGGVINGALPTPLTLEFSGLSGTITGLFGGYLTFAYDAGVGSVALKQGATTLANYSIASPSTGVQNTGGGLVGGFAPDGTNDILALVSNSGYLSNLFRDSTGTSLDSNVLAGTLFAAVHTNNVITTNGTETLPDGDIQLHFSSNGQYNLATVPEPGSIALMGIGLMGLGFRKSAKSSSAAMGA